MVFKKRKIGALEILLDQISKEPLLLRKGQYELTNTEMKFLHKLRQLKKIDYETYTRFHLTYIEIQNAKLTNGRQT